MRFVQRVCRIGNRHAECLCTGQRTQRIVYGELSRNTQLHLGFALCTLAHKADAVRMQLNICSAQVTSFMLAIGQERTSLLLQHELTCRIVQIGHTGLALMEQ